MRGRRVLFTAELSGDVTLADLRGLWNWMKANLNIGTLQVDPTVTVTKNGRHAHAVFDEGSITIRKEESRLYIEVTFLRLQDVQALKAQVQTLPITGILHTFEDDTEF